MLIDADLSALEVRVAAFLSQDPVLCQEVRSGFDMHTDNAIKFFGSSDDTLRTLAKSISFLLIYGGSAYALHLDHKMPKLGIKKYEQVVEEFYKKYKILKQWQDKNYAIVCKQGYLVNPTGRILTFHKQMKGGVLQYNRPDICNYPVQSFATADIVPLTMIVVNQRLKREGLYDVKIINQVHDSIILDTPDKYVDRVCSLVYNVFKEIPQLVERCFGFEYNIPMSGECKYGQNWNSLVKWTPQ